MEERSSQYLLKPGDREKADPGSYRPICLLHVVGKLFEGVLLRLLKPTLEIRSSEAQYEFREGRSTEDAITRLYTITEEAEEAEERYVMAIFVDIQSAFDSLWWPALIAELKQRVSSQSVPYN